jgi:2-polyprenyl-3-methyl-5-hydroxy-6-metoxy-1,4-benzoquinol methylase
MPERAYHEAIWRQVPAGSPPERFALRREFLLAAVRPGQRVLDLGCGEGAFAAALREAGVRVLAADVAEEPLRRALASHPGLELELLASETAWELPDAAFDAVWAGEVIEHVADTSGWMSEIRRVLRPNGLLLLTTPALDRASLLAALLSGRAFRKRFDPRSDHLRRYSRASLAELISDFGFEQLAVRAAGRPGARVLLASAVRSRF